MEKNKKQLDRRRLGMLLGVNMRYYLAVLVAVLGGGALFGLISPWVENPILALLASTFLIAVVLVYASKYLKAKPSAV